MTTLKRLSLIIALTCGSTLAFAQDESAVTVNDDTTVETTVENVTAEDVAASEKMENSSTVKYSCANAGQVRRVEVEFETQDAPVPCSVTYHKDTEAPGQVSTLWSADNEVGYCEAKAAAFVEKLRSWGWACNQG